MCGIGGAIRFGTEPIDRSVLFGMREAMARRGPDGAGLWMDDDERVGLVHRRLAIQDTSNAGHQPMSHGDLCIVYNGEIYNFRELRAELVADGHTFQSGSDTEVLLHLFDRYGIEMVRRLRGMYAFAIWDKARGKLHLARDPFGMKPLYYAVTPSHVYFASQVKAIPRSLVDTGMAPAGHVGFFLWGSVPEPYTLYRGIRAVRSGEWLTFDASGSCQIQERVTLHQLLQDAICRASFKGSRDDALHLVAQELSESVRLHLVSDVPVGLFLSAGLDSSLIASILADLGVKAQTLTVGFREFESSVEDEAPIAEEVAKHFGTDHRTVYVDSRDFSDGKTELLSAMDQPTIDGVNTWLVAKIASTHGLKVVMSGLGGDEIFASYPSFETIPQLRKMSAWLPSGLLGRAARLAIQPLANTIGKPKLAGLAEYASTIGGRYLLRRALFMPWELVDFLDAELVSRGWQELGEMEELEAVGSALAPERLAISALEMSFYMRNQLLRDADWAAMAHSVEVRVPLVDVRLLQALAPIFAAYPDIRKRDVVHEAAPTMPAQVLERPKTGFQVPLREWLSGRQGSLTSRKWAREVYADFVTGG